MSSSSSSSSSSSLSLMSLSLSSLFFSCSWKGIIEATGLVLLTTLDDCVWLVPFVAAAPTRRIATLHAVTFLLTLEGLAILLSIGTLLFFLVVLGADGGGAGGGGADINNETTTAAITTNTTTTTTSSTTSSGEASDQEEQEDPMLAIIAAILCWILAGYLIYKRCQKLKRRKRQRRQQEEDQQQQNTSNTTTTASASASASASDYGTIPATTPITPNIKEESGLFDDDDDATTTTTPAAAASAAKPGMVLSLTCLGFLDEVAYFPSLILGRIFSALELCIASVLAGLIMVGIVTICLAPCQPFIDWLDTHVKMYGVVTLFAIVLTIQVLVEEW